MENLKVCIDLSGTQDERLVKLYHAFNEREANVLNESTRRSVNISTRIEQTLLDAKVTSDPERLITAGTETREKLLELALEKDSLWENGRTITVRFLGGTDLQQRQVMRYARAWEAFANIKFNFLTSGAATVRVAFMAGRGSWSQVGTDALSNTDQTQPTMNFGWFTDATPENEFRRTIVHEFGHCLGCIHEHQSPAAAIKWNKPVVYDYYARTQGWDEAKVNHNLFATFNQTTITNSRFDPNSIMIYPIPARFTLDGFQVGWNDDLSAHDKAFIARCYPKPSI